MRIGILGSGNVGTGLGRGWIKSGHAITYGVRDPGSPKARAAAEVSGATVTDHVAAVRTADVIVLAVPFGAIESLAAEIRDEVVGKVVVDATNAVAWGGDGPRPAFEGTTGAEMVARALPGARVVKAFNTIGANHFAHPVLSGQRTMMAVCGADAEAVDAVLGLADDLGFEPVNVGPLHNAALVENLALLWMYLATRGGMGRDFAFAVARD